MIAWELNLQLIAMRVIAGLIGLPVQALAITYLATVLGDKGPGYDGRMTINPAAHTELPGLLSLVLTGFGWSRPVVVSAGELRLGRSGLVLLTLSGSMAMVALAWFAMQLVTPALLVLPHTAGITVAAFMRLSARLYLGMAVLALFPIPCLAGRHTLQALGLELSGRATIFSSWVLLVVSIFGLTRLVVSPVWIKLTSVVVGTG